MKYFRNIFHKYSFKIFISKIYNSRRNMNQDNSFYKAKFRPSQKGVSGTKESLAKRNKNFIFRITAFICAKCFVAFIAPFILFEDKRSCKHCQPLPTQTSSTTDLQFCNECRRYAGRICTKIQPPDISQTVCNQCQNKTQVIWYVN